MVVYTVLAGMLSIVALDLFNGLLITGGVFLAAPLALKAAGGWSGLTQALPAEHFTIFGSLGVVPALGLFLPTFFLLLGESSMYQKFMSAFDERSARRAVIGMIAGVVLIETILNATAVFGAGIYQGDPALGNGETIILQLARYDLPAAAGVVLLAGAVAIIFSTANTFLMIPSTNLTRDVFQRFLRPDASPSTLIWFQRGSIVVLAVISFIVSSFFESILDMALYAYTMVGAAVTPALLAAFLWRRVTPAGGTVSIAAGMLVTVGFAVSNAVGLTQWDYNYIIYPAGAASILCLIVVSLATPASPEAKWRPFWS